MQENKSGISKRAVAVKRLIKKFNKNVTLKSYFIDKNRSESDIDKKFKYPEHLTTRQIVRDNYKMELLSPVNTDSKWVVLQLHGGGYVSAFKNNYRTVAGFYSEVCSKASVLSVDYRIAPKHPYPAALEDAVDAYKWLLSEHYDGKHIFLAGDSAGGGLSIALVMYLREHKIELPAGLVLMSPWVDLTASGRSYEDNYAIDIVFGNRRDSLIYNNPYSGNMDPCDPFISPIFGDYHAFPPMLIQVGSEEMLLDDSKAVATKAKQAGVSVRYSEYNGMFHVFQMAAKTMPEARKAWSEIGRFFELLQGDE